MKSEQANQKAIASKNFGGKHHSLQLATPLTHATIFPSLSPRTHTKFPKQQSDMLCLQAYSPSAPRKTYQVNKQSYNYLTTGLSQDISRVPPLALAKSLQPVDVETSKEQFLKTHFSRRLS